MEEWNRTRRPDVKGVVGGYLLRPDTKPDELIMVAIFEDKQTYEANAGDPAQDRWYRRLREDLQDDPAWEDGEFLVG
jgi:quinol monooxygenase YgiN